MLYGKRDHYDLARSFVADGIWQVDAEAGVILGKGRTRDKWRPLGSVRSGYLRVRLGYHGPSVGVHRVIFESVHGPSDLTKTINHINGNKLDNRIGNLELATNAENIQHGYAIGLIHCRDARGERNNLAKLTEDQVREIRRLRAAGVTGRKVAKLFNVSEQVVSQIHTRHAWRHVA